MMNDMNKIIEPKYFYASIEIAWIESMIDLIQIIKFLLFWK